MSPDELGLIQRYRMYSYMHLNQKVKKNWEMFRDTKYKKLNIFGMSVLVLLIDNYISLNEIWGLIFLAALKFCWEALIWYSIHMQSKSLVLPTNQSDKNLNSILLVFVEPPIRYFIAYMQPYWILHGGYVSQTFLVFHCCL